jgi:hypothetical protein
MTEQYVSCALRAPRTCNTHSAVVKQPLQTARMFRYGRGPPVAVNSCSVERSIKQLVRWGSSDLGRKVTRTREHVNQNIYCFSSLLGCT